MTVMTNEALEEFAGLIAGMREHACREAILVMARSINDFSSDPADILNDAIWAGIDAAADKAMERTPS